MSIRIAATTVGELLVARFGTAGEPVSAEAAWAGMVGAVETANGRVRAAARGVDDFRRMATVIVIALVRSPVGYICHAGDARAYLARGSGLTRLTEDDSVVAGLIRKGEITPAQARRHRLRHFVTKMVGRERPVEANFGQVELAEGDWLLLCSDGLWNMVKDEAILALLQQAEGDPARAAEALVEAANAAGGEDNISVVAVRVVASGEHGGGAGAGPATADHSAEVREGLHPPALPSSGRPNCVAGAGGVG